MSAHRVAGIIAAWCALSLAPACASAQVTIQPQKDLDFGQIEPSVANIVAPTDNRGRAVFRVRATGSYIAQFTLPGSLVGVTGASLPLSFGPGDAIARSGNTQIVFDPTMPFPFVGAGGNRNWIFWLGGTAGPGPGVPIGTYTAIITLTIIQAGA